MIKKLFKYPELERVEKNDVRYYRDSKENLVPSVTTILSATGDHSGIDAWKRRVGPKTAKEVVDEATTIGTAVPMVVASSTTSFAVLGPTLLFHASIPE